MIWKDKTRTTVNKKLRSVIGNLFENLWVSTSSLCCVLSCLLIGLYFCPSFYLVLIPRLTMSRFSPLPLVGVKRNETCVPRRTKVCFFNPHQSFRACWHLHKQTKLSEQTSYDDETEPLWMSSPAAGVSFFFFLFLCKSATNSLICSLLQAMRDFLQIIHSFSLCAFQRTGLIIGHLWEIVAMFFLFVFLIN